MQWENKLHFNSVIVIIMIKWWYNFRLKEWWKRQTADTYSIGWTDMFAQGIMHMHMRQARTLQNRGITQLGHYADTVALSAGQE